MQAVDGLSPFTFRKVLEYSNTGNSSGGYIDNYIGRYASSCGDPVWRSKFDEAAELSYSAKYHGDFTRPSLTRDMVIAVVPNKHGFPTAIRNTVVLTGGEIVAHVAEIDTQYSHQRSGMYLVDGGNTVTQATSETEISIVSNTINDAGASTLLVGNVPFTSNFLLSGLNSTTQNNTETDDGNQGHRIRTNTVVSNFDFNGTGTSLLYEDLENGIALVERVTAHRNHAYNKVTEDDNLDAAEYGSIDETSTFQHSIKIELIVVKGNSTKVLRTREFSEATTMRTVSNDMREWDTAFAKAEYSVSPMYTQFNAGGVEYASQQRITTGTGGNCTHEVGHYAYYNTYETGEQPKPLTDEYPQRPWSFRFSNIFYDLSSTYETGQDSDEKQAIAGMLNILDCSYQYRWADQGFGTFSTSGQFSTILKAACVDGHSVIRLRTADIEIWRTSYIAEDIVLLDGVEQGPDGNPGMGLPPAKDILNLFVT